MSTMGPGGDELPEPARQPAGSYRRANAQMHFRSHAEIQRFFDGFELVPPGLTPQGRVTDLDEEAAQALATAGRLGVGRKR